MSLFVASLNSGSNGNCYYIGTMEECVLIDCGIGIRETVRRMKRLGLSPKKLKGIFLTHEHSDHTVGIPSLARKYGLPVYGTLPTFQEARLKLPGDLIKPITPNESLSIGNLIVHAFPKLHDAVDPIAFVVESGGVKVGVFTDLGKPSETVIDHFRQCHAAFLESNYDEEMLMRGDYPFHLKNRIHGDSGHLSNEQAFKLYAMHAPSFMSHLFLSHLSNNNNKIKLVREAFSTFENAVEIIIASRHRETKLYHVRSKSGLGNFKRTTDRHGEQLQLHFS
jgi:phosphoribosyl 1,2-cyclic phosphodiesterase